MQNCTFERIKIDAYNSVLQNCTLVDCSLQINDKMKLEKCTLIKGEYVLRNHYSVHPYNSSLLIMAPNGKELVLDGCRIKSTNPKLPIFTSWLHQTVDATLDIKDTTAEPDGILNTSIFKTVKGQIK